MPTVFREVTRPCGELVTLVVKRHYATGDDGCDCEPSEIESAHTEREGWGAVITGEEDEAWTEAIDAAEGPPEYEPLEDDVF